MKFIDKIVGLIFKIAVMGVLSIGGLMLYVLALLLLMYKCIRNQVDFMKEFDDINREYVSSIKTCIKKESKK